MVVLPFIQVLFQSLKLVWLVSNSLGPILSFSSRHFSFLPALWALSSFPWPCWCYRPACSLMHCCAITTLFNPLWLPMDASSWVNCPDSFLGSGTLSVPLPLLHLRTGRLKKEPADTFQPNIGSTASLKSVWGLMTVGYHTSVCPCHRYTNECESICDSREVLPLIYAAEHMPTLPLSQGVHSAHML